MMTAQFPPRAYNILLMYLYDDDNNYENNDDDIMTLLNLKMQANYDIKKGHTSRSNDGRLSNLATYLLFSY